MFDKISVFYLLIDLTARNVEYLILQVSLVLFVTFLDDSPNVQNHYGNDSHVSL